MIRLTLLALLAGTTAASAHPGHLGEASGHTHYLALAALVLAIAVVLTALPPVRRAIDALFARRRAR